MKVSELFVTDTFKHVVLCLAQSGYKDDKLWKGIREAIITNRGDIDAIGFIDLRNAYLLHFPEELAMISYLEQRYITMLYMFGKT